MSDIQPPMRLTRGIQQSLFGPASPSLSKVSTEPKGVVYTKRWVVELLLDLAGYISTSNLVDSVAIEPAAGDGAFLGPMIERLVKSCLNLNRPLLDCRNSIVAYELEGASAENARELATRTLLDNGVDWHDAVELAHGWTRIGDYLLEAASTDADFVIGNPPYVRLEEIPEETATLYRRSYVTMGGRADLYVAFFEAALSQLKDGGVCAFICADRWMRNQYGARLREFVTSHFGVEVVIEMHNAGAFQDEVDAYPAITIIRRGKQGPTVVASAGSDAAGTAPGALSNAIQATARQETPSPALGLRSALVSKWFKGSDPWPCSSPSQLALLRLLEERFPPLEANAKVGIGVATGNDGVFITKNESLVEHSRLLKLAMASDLSGGSMQWSGRYLLDPWNSSGLVNLADYPRLAAYFGRHAEALRKRHTAARNELGWYKTIDRVTHTLTARPKLYIADIKNTLDPVLDLGETYPHHNLYYIYSDTWDLEILGGLLMSAVGQFFVESYGVRMRGGYLRFQAQYLRRIRVPNPESLSQSECRELRASFRHRDRMRATRAALVAYGLQQNTMEIALGT